MTQEAKQKKGGGTIALIAIIALCVLSVPCVGIGAAVAIPAFIGYLNDAKTAEARHNLQALYTGAAAYYESESWGARDTVLAGGAAAQTACVTGSGITSNVPGPGKTVLGPLGDPFDSLGFALADPVYYRYEVVGVGGCGHTAGEAVYSFRAYGDLDGDGTTSLYELTATVGADGTLQRSPAIYTENELE